MAKQFKARIKRAVEDALAGIKAKEALCDTLSEACRSAKAQVEDVMLDYANEHGTKAEAGNPYHIMRSTLGNNCTPRYGVTSVKSKDDDGKLIKDENDQQWYDAVKITRKTKTSTASRQKKVTHEQAFTSFESFLSNKSENFLKALAYHDDKTLGSLVRRALRKSRG